MSPGATYTTLWIGSGVGIRYETRGETHKVSGGSGRYGFGHILGPKNAVASGRG